MPTPPRTTNLFVARGCQAKPSRGAKLSKGARCPSAALLLVWNTPAGIGPYRFVLKLDGTDNPARELPAYGAGKLGQGAATTGTGCVKASSGLMLTFFPVRSYG